MYLECNGVCVCRERMWKTRQETRNSGLNLEKGLHSYGSEVENRLIYPYVLFEFLPKLVIPT